MIHIKLEHKYFRSKRDEWAIRVWRDLKYKRPMAEKNYLIVADPAIEVSGIGELPVEGQQGTTTLREIFTGMKEGG